MEIDVEERFEPQWSFRVQRDTTALLIIDMQNDFMHDDGYYGRRAKEWGYNMEYRRAAIPHVRRLAEAMRNAGVPVIYCQTMWERDYTDAGIPLQVNPEARESSFGVKGSWGVQILDELRPQRNDHIVEAKCFSKFPYTPLELILRNLGIKTLIFTGVGSNVCVESTLRYAVDLGFQCIVTSDGTAAKDHATHEAMLQRTSRFFGMVMTCEEVRQLLFDKPK